MTVEVGAWDNSVSTGGTTFLRIIVTTEHDYDTGNETSVEAEEFQARDMADAEAVTVAALTKRFGATLSIVDDVHIAPLDATVTFDLEAIRRPAREAEKRERQRRYAEQDAAREAAEAAKVAAAEELETLRRRVKELEAGR